MTSDLIPELHHDTATEAAQMIFRRWCAIASTYQATVSQWNATDNWGAINAMRQERDRLKVDYYRLTGAYPVLPQPEDTP